MGYISFFKLTGLVNIFSGGWDDPSAHGKLPKSRKSFYMPVYGMLKLIPVSGMSDPSPALTFKK